MAACVMEFNAYDWHCNGRIFGNVIMIYRHKGHRLVNSYLNIRYGRNDNYFL